jgi:hypothetical protein
MARYADTSVEVPEWVEVSSAQSCPICGGSSQCAVHEDGEFVRCLAVVSDWPIVTGGWRHRIESRMGERRPIVGSLGRSRLIDG